MRRSFCLAAFLVSAAVPAATAQQPPVKKSAFDTVIKQPTGRNGYEELVLAGDTLQDSRLWKQVESEPNATLTMKRAVLADRQVAQALRLLRQGLDKPVVSPREKSTFDTLLPELIEFRSLGRLLALQQYVFLADGRVGGALANARLALRLGQAVQTDTLLSGLIGISIGTMCIQTMGAHLDQLSARDAETLYAICLEWLRQPSPEARLMDTERRNALNSLEVLRGQPVERLISSVNLDPTPKPDDDDSIRKGRQLAAELRRFGADQPEAVDRLYTDTEKQLDALYGQVLEQFRLPLWQRRFPERTEDGTMASRLVSLLAPTLTGVGNAYARDQARVRMLACHAAIVRYRWEHNRVPATLPELNLGELAQDPFTGQPLQYQALGTHYRLTSVGPESSPDNPPE